APSSTRLAPTSITAPDATRSMVPDADTAATRSAATDASDSPPLDEHAPRSERPAASRAPEQPRARRCTHQRHRRGLPAAPLPPPVVAVHNAAMLEALTSTVVPHGDQLVELDPDHPGFRDPIYRARRNAIAKLALEHREGAPPPHIAYSDLEHDVWRS